MRSSCGCAILAVLAGLTSAGQGAVVSDNFSTNPLGPGSPWTFGVGSNVNNQFQWNSDAPAYTGDAPGSLAVQLNSSLPTARFDRPLGMSLSDSSSFVVSARFSLDIQSAPGDQSMEIAFGLTNSASTGGDRTGTPANFSSDNTYNTVEFDYFPNVDPTYGGPTLTPTIFGGQEGDAFTNFDSIFGDASNLGTHATGITSLPQGPTLDAELAYDGATKTATLTMFQVNSDGSLTLLDTGPLQMNLTDFGSPYDPTNPFVVNTLSIMAYQDGYTMSGDPSVVATLTFQDISLSTSVPEPAAIVLALLASLGAAAAAWRAKRFGG